MGEAMGKVRLGIIGTGGMGGNHLRNALAIPTVTVAALCDTDPGRLSAAVAELKVPGFSSYEKLIDAGVVDAVLVSTPHFQHTPVAVAAFARNLHVLTEKPVAVHVNDVRKMTRAYQEARARKPGLQFAAMFQQRTLPAWRKVKEMLDAGQLGKILRATWIVTDWFRPQVYFGNGWRGTWKGDGGGVLLNQSPHQVDLFWWFFGLPSRVHGFAGFGKYHAIEVEDEVSAFFEYADGKIGHLITGTAECPGTNRLEIAAEMGKIVVEAEAIRFQRTASSALDYIRDSKEPFGKLASADVPVPIDPVVGSPHKAVLENFAEAILHGSPLVAPAEEGIHSVMMTNAIILSAKRGMPVDLPLEGGEVERLLSELASGSKAR
jgi:predicted dehydrogenase